MDEDDDDEFYGGLYENGHWDWNEQTQRLEFKSDLPPVNELVTPEATFIGSMGFRDLDLMEQQRFRKRFQRKTTDSDVVTLQDIKDLVLFTAPKAILTVSIVNVLHLPVMERFLRGLITYCQYYLQIADEMDRRMTELRIKIRTSRSKKIESEFRDNLEDLRLLVAKEYCAIIMGSGDLAKYHHMGPLRKSRSLSKKESILFESILLISTQIVWLALGRKAYNKIELEIHRMFKSDIYNIIEHKLGTEYRQSLCPKELFVLFGHCLRQGRMTNSLSPLMTEVDCVKDIDYRLMGLGVINYEKLNARLRYFERVLIAPEMSMKSGGINIGILGLPRTRFDTMLKEIKITVSTASSTSANMKFSNKSMTARASRVSTCSSSGKGANLAPRPLYEDIYIPDKEDITELISERFPSHDMRRKSCSEEQRKKWLAHIHRLHTKNRSIKSKKKT